MTTRPSVTPKEPRHFCQVRRTQFSTLSHLPTVLPRAAEVREPGVTLRCLQPSHFSRVCLEFPGQFLKPSVADTKCPGPRATGGPAAVAGEPLENVSPDHVRFLTAAPRPRRSPPHPRFCEIP